MYRATGAFSSYVEFDGRDWVTIGHGVMALTGKSQKRVHVADISTVQYRPAGLFTRGFISFSMAGAREARSVAIDQVMQAARDENSAVFLRKQQPDFDSIRNAIESAMADYRRRGN